MGMPKFPLDPFPYAQDPRSQRLHPRLQDGNYVFVKNCQGEIFILPDGPHLHPKVLGKARPALYAGDLVVKAGEIVSLTNLSGTFQFEDSDGLREVAEWCQKIGFTIRPHCVRFFDPATGHCLIVE